ncbi:MAG: sulfotransferase domain-containing protein [Desulfobacteraceae bacterium]|nr:sulfotransferase domain-containing protein [Desulfobacteraceae bacterium]
MIKKRDIIKIFINIARKFNPPIENIYFATIQKSGSQYIKQVFSDKRIQYYTKLLTYPQHRYEWDEFHKKFPKGTFVPGLYMSYDLYEEIEKPKSYKTFYVMRDPRNIVVSWYYSMMKTHKLMGKVGRYRKELQKLSFKEGLHYCIDALSIKFMAMRTWKNNENDPAVLILKFEDLKENPYSEFLRIFEHCGINIPHEVLKSVLSDYTKDKMREKDLANRVDITESHYRKTESKHQEVFEADHYKHFYQVTGNLVEILGYEKS